MRIPKSSSLFGIQGLFVSCDAGACRQEDIAWARFLCVFVPSWFKFNAFSPQRHEGHKEENGEQASAKHACFSMTLKFSCIHAPDSAGLLDSLRAANYDAPVRLAVANLGRLMDRARHVGRARVSRRTRLFSWQFNPTNCRNA
jgi:hypothetical protein